MVKLYVDLINKGLRTLEQVPEVWKSEVKKQLDEQEG